MIKRDFHVHLHGCLTAEQLWLIGRDSYKKQSKMLDWYASEYKKAWGRTPNYSSYWASEAGFDLLKQDYIFEHKSDFQKFQAKFNLIIALCSISSDDFAIQEQIIRSVNDHGLDYFEARTLLPFRFSAEEAYTYLKNLSNLVTNLNQELHMKTSIVFSLFRDNVLAEKQYLWIRDFMDKHADLSRVISGIDFAYAEESHPPKDKIALFHKFRKDNQTKRALNLLYHVGESFSDKSIFSAIRWILEVQSLGADRLGHAIALGIDPENYRGSIAKESRSEKIDHLHWLIQNKHELQAYGYDVDSSSLKRQLDNLPSCEEFLFEYHQETICEARLFQKAAAGILKEQQAIIECCPSSNLRIGNIKDPAYHPLKFFHEHKLDVVLGTDDPGIFNIDWKSEAEFAKILLGEAVAQFPPLLAKDH
ncbi:MAG: hypothetical protein KA436_02685 [Oligoflexales bacterium]|nr:hypothetical protein [Oligoflexales bacterium]